ncbi:hypothetical protein [Microbacterium ureisolvens]|uniref:DUF3618 domain-containing protein n=1 Tax=Microbacterium ureisolvens TaxID=2781186 RepID=A0ABS7I0X8_9MICO|nr:hypothetical protein [Microbacterium ureisolvens]MBW9111040.1 hypothetical protein [Microbacterium ureisolvens]
MSTYDTDPYATQSTGTGQSTGSGDMKERVVDGVAEVDAGAMYVAGVAGDEAKSVAHDAKDAARGFLYEARTELSDQASSQQRRAASALRSTSDELTGLADGTATGSGGMATDAVRAFGQQTRRVADWLEQREPADVIYEVRTFARRHTGAFLAIAVGVGLLAGRVTKALVSDAHDGERRAGGTLGQGGARPALVTGSPTTAGTAAAGYGGTAAGAATVGTTGYAGDTPIGDALAGDPLTTGTDPAVTTGAAGDEWSATGEGRR